MGTAITPQEVLELLRELKLKHMGQALESEMATMSDKEREIFLPRMGGWLRTEKAERRSQTINGKIRTAKFRKIQTVDTFNFKRCEATEKAEKSYLTLHRSIARDSLPSAIFSGSAGMGKTHLARALGFAACQKGLSVLFLTAAEMVNHLAHAQKTFNLEQELNKYRRPQVLIIDELGYVSLDTQASNLFFQVISARHDHDLGTIATTNITFGKFNQIFASDAIAHAIVDRLVNGAEVFYLEGPSYRPEERKQKLRRKRENA